MYVCKVSTECHCNERETHKNRSDFLCYYATLNCIEFNTNSAKFCACEWKCNKFYICEAHAREWTKEMVIREMQIAICILYERKTLRHINLEILNFLQSLFFFSLLHQNQHFLPDPSQAIYYIPSSSLMFTQSGVHSNNILSSVRRVRENEETNQPFRIP